MTGPNIALDTNEAIAVLNDVDDAGRWITTFSRVFLPVPVVGELRFGAVNSRKAHANIDRIDNLLKRCRVLDVNVETTLVYANVRSRLKQAGRPIPENDVWIAALCIQHDLPLASSDQHFLHVEGLRLVRR